MGYVHTIRNYDYEERVSAFWNKYTVQFTNEELSRWGEAGGMKVVDQVGDTKIIKWDPPKSNWEDLFS